MKDEILAGVIASVLGLAPIGSRSGSEILNEVRSRYEAESGRSSGDSLSLDGFYAVEVRGPDGAVKDVRIGHNLICTAGKNQLLAASGAKTISQFAYIAVGSSGTAPAIGDTVLGTQVARSTVITPTNPSASVLQFQFTFSAGVATGALQECGLFDASSGGNLLSHLTFSVINVGASDTIQITYQIS